MGPARGSLRDLCVVSCMLSGLGAPAARSWSATRAGLAAFASSDARRGRPSDPESEPEFRPGAVGLSGCPLSLALPAVSPAWASPGGDSGHAPSALFQARASLLALEGTSRDPARRVTAANSEARVSVPLGGPGVAASPAFPDPHLCTPADSDRTLVSGAYKTNRHQTPCESHAGTLVC